jgi:hypothetical protein
MKPDMKVKMRKFLSGVAGEWKVKAWDNAINEAMEFSAHVYNG